MFAASARRAVPRLARGLKTSAPAGGVRGKARPAEGDGAPTPTHAAPYPFQSLPRGGDDPIEVNGMRGRECLGVGRARRRLKHGFLGVVL